MTIDNDLVTAIETHELIDVLVGDVGETLNALLQTSHSKHYWWRCFGYWLANFTDIARVEWNQVIHLSTDSNHERFGALNHIQRATLKMTELLDQSQQADWRARLQQDAADFFHYGLLDLTSQTENSDQYPASQVHSKRVSEWIELQLRKLLFEKRRYIFVTTRLPRFVEAVVALRLLSAPARWVEPKGQHNPYSFHTRQWIDRSLQRSTNRSFENFLRAVLAYYLPMSVVEDFVRLTRKLEIKTTKPPKAIFSANLHFSSDAFAFWCAEQAERGSSILLSQHGGLNGQGLIPTNDEIIERRIADLYCHWGWADDPRSRRIPAQVNVFARGRRRFRHSGEIILMCDATFRFQRRIYLDSNRYRLHILNIYRAIVCGTRSAPKVRLHRDHDRYDDSHVSMWNEEFPEATLDHGLDPVRMLYKTAKLVVCTTLGTTEIECFGRNIPVVITLDPQLHRIRATFSELLNEMQNVGLVHWSPDSLKNFLLVNADLAAWWNSMHVRQVIQQYLERFGHSSSRPISDYVLTLRNATDSSIGCFNN